MSVQHLILTNTDNFYHLLIILKYRDNDDREGNNKDNNDNKEGDNKDGDNHDDKEGNNEFNI